VSVIALMPYYRVRGSQQFGDYYLRTVGVADVGEVLAAPYVDWMRWYLSRYQGYDGKAEPVTIVHTGDFLLPDSWSDSDLRRLADTISLMSLAFLTTELDEWGPIAENFVLYTQKFKPDSRFLAVTSGSLITYTDGRPEASPPTFMRPPYVRPWGSEHWQGRRGEQLLAGLSKAVREPTTDAKWLNTVVRSGRLFADACANVDWMDPFERLVLMIASYQALLLPGASNGRALAEAVVMAIECSDPSEEEWIERFCLELWSLRSKFSHGAEMAEKDKEGLLHTITVGRWLFGQVLLQQLRARGYVPAVDPLQRHIEFTFGKPEPPAPEDYDI